MSDLDVIIPVKNEAENINELVQRIDTSLRKVNIDYRIIFVDDYSTDNTLAEIVKASQNYPVAFHIKAGRAGKAYSILEGSSLATSEYIAMIDGDLQYPPEALPSMYELAKQHGVVVANRKKRKTSLLRTLGSKINMLLFEKLLHGFSVDTQSGLKIFRKEIVNQLSDSDVTGWTVDMPLLKTALEMGYTIGCVDIEFAERKNGESKIKFARAAKEIASASVKLKLKKKKVYKIAGESNGLNAGVAHKGSRFITHTHLPVHQSAIQTFATWQKFAFAVIGLFILFGLAIDARVTAIVLIAFLSALYFIDLIFSLRVLLKSLHFPPEIKIGDDELEKIDNFKLPTYTILCPLYKEAEILPQFIKSLDELDWPKDKLEALLLLEEDDTQTLAVTNSMVMPSYMKVVIVPNSQPRTKPKACNYGLHFAKGDYVVIYDAEDKPDPLQLKKAYLAFQKSPTNVICLQSKLNYYNTDHNLITRLFTAEYSLWFDLILPGLQSIEAAIPLGGTSNHFKTARLRELNGWDPFNVTEDCDLGVRIFKSGYKTALIDSTTYEEANARPLSWIKQRSRWIKGYLQTYLVHMRNPVEFVRRHGKQAFIFQMVVGMRMVFILINPILWAATLSYFLLYQYVGPQIEALYPAPVFYIAVFSLIFGNFMYFYNYMIGLAKKEQWSVMKFVFLIPFYWVMTSIAAAMAFYQLFVKPYYWEKTAHGLHTKAERKEEKIQTLRLRRFLNTGLAGGGAMVGAAIVANFVNFAYNAYLGRVVDLDDFGTISLIGNIYTLAGVITSSVGAAVTYKSAYMLGKFDKIYKDFWIKVRKKSWVVALAMTLVWSLAIPFMVSYFKSDSTIPFILFIPVWVAAFVGAVDGGFLNGNLKFLIIAGLALLAPIVKLIVAAIAVSTGHVNGVYAAIPASLLVTFLIGWFVVIAIKSEKAGTNLDKEFHFPKDFFAASILSRLAAVAFLSFDIILAKHYLTPIQAGEYALLSLSGKIIYFLGSLFTQFITPLISKYEGAKKESSQVFYKLLFASTLTSLVGFLFIGIFGKYTVPFLFGGKAASIIAFLPFYSLAMVAFTITSAIVTYHQIKREYIFPVIGFLVALLEVYGISQNHSGVFDITQVVVYASLFYLVVVFVLHVAYKTVLAFIRNSVDFMGLFTRLDPYASKPLDGKLKILIYNWRDTKHVWAGGAEVYVHELAKRWVKKGHQVTVFCGYDGNGPRDGVTDKVRVIRRGGFYTVYPFAFLYYIAKLRNKFDAVVDCENGIPFFAPLYVGKPKILVIHHIHQDVFRKHLIFPLSSIAAFMEATVMPFIYRHVPMVTISNSSKKDITKRGWGNGYGVEIVSPGIDLSLFKKMKKTKQASIAYLGRLKAYKNIDVAIKAFFLISEKYPEATLTIAGFGEELESLKSLVAKLNLGNRVIFTGKVSEQAKVELFAKSWFAVQPSSFEGWGITVIEANACATPVLAANVKGLKDSVVDGETGILVKEGNYERLAVEFDKLISSQKELKKLSHNAYTWSRNFSWNKRADEFLQIIIKHVRSRAQVSFSRGLVFTDDNE